MPLPRWGQGGHDPNWFPCSCRDAVEGNCPLSVLGSGETSRWDGEPGYRSSPPLLLIQTVGRPVPVIVLLRVTGREEHRVVTLFAQRCNRSWRLRRLFLNEKN